MIEKQLIKIEDNISTHTLCISLMVALMGKDIMVLNNGALFSLRYDLLTTGSRHRWGMN